MTLGLIWAQSSNGVIGVDGALPWSVPEDQRNFRTVTAGCAVIMGRRTWDSLPARFRPLPGRANLVLTRQKGFSAAGAETVQSVDDVLARQLARAWVIGGESVYRDFIQHAETLVVTEVELVIEGDTHAPAIGAQWQATTPPPDWATSTSGLRYRVLTYGRVT